MANDSTAEQVELRRKSRHRLIGAIVLALVAVVFVPMLLDPEPRRERAEPVLAIPARESAPPLAAAVKAPGPAQKAQSQPPNPASAEAAPAAPDASASPQPRAAATVTENATVLKKTAKLETAPPPRAAPKQEGFAVQVGAFKDEATLAQARDKIAAAQFAHFTERLDAASGGLTRLRAGPFPTRAGAEKAAVQLQRAGLDARVVTLP